MARRDPGFGHIVGNFDTTLVLHNAPREVIASWVGADVSLDPTPTAPDGSHPYFLALVRTDPCHFSLLPFLPVRVRALVLAVPNVRIAHQARGYSGPYCLVLRWWSAGGALVRVGGRMLGLPPDAARMTVELEKVAGVVEVPGQVKMTLRDHGDNPEWPRVRELCRIFQQPLLARRPDGSWRAAGMYWNVSNADMRSCEARTEILPTALPSGALCPDGALRCTVDGTRDLATGGTFRLGAVATLTRSGSVMRDWSAWKAGPKLRLRVELSSNEIGPLAERGDR